MSRLVLRPQPAGPSLEAHRREAPQTDFLHALQSVAQLARRKVVAVDVVRDTGSYQLVRVRFAEGPGLILRSVAHHSNPRTAMLWAFEAYLQDAEDLMLTLPYSEIRHRIQKASAALFQPMTGQLLIVGSSQDPNSPCYLNRTGRGCPVVEGCLLRAMERSPADVVLWSLYSCLKALHTIVISYQSTHDSAVEIAARQQLIAALASLRAIQYRTLNPRSLLETLGPGGQRVMATATSPAAAAANASTSPCAKQPPQHPPSACVTELGHQINLSRSHSSQV